MDEFDNELEHPKKRRRRMNTPKPLSAHLTFDDQIRGEVALLSEDLWLDLVEQESEDQRRGSSQDHHVAISAWTPRGTPPTDVLWTIIPARRKPTSTIEDPPGPRSTIRVSVAAQASQSFLRTLHAQDTIRHAPKSIEIRALYAEPLLLDTIYVTVEKNLLEKVDEIQHKFGGGFHTGKAGNHAKGRGPAVEAPNPAPTTPEARMMDLVREGLSKLAVIHSGDVFALSLPSHPITHVPPPPAIVVGCEPVTQGMVSSSTRIVIEHAGGATQQKALKTLQPAHAVMDAVFEDTEDTSNEQFYSAAEDKSGGLTSEADDVPSDDPTTEDSVQEHSDEDSDDSMEDMISLSAPGLPAQQSGTLSAMADATPRPGGRKTTGIQTPGSVYSSFTSATARASTRPGKVFRTDALLQNVPLESLHPRPGTEDDQEAFVFVDTSVLGKIGCFSGDWVRIEVARNVGLVALSLGLGGNDEEEGEWHTVRVFGLSSLTSQKPRYAVDKSGERRSSFSQFQSAPLTPTIYLPPVLLANLRNAAFVKVGVLPKPGKIPGRVPQPEARSSSSNEPPLAKEVNLTKLSTPFSTSSEMQPALFSMLKRHFEKKRRILKRDDLVAISADEEFGKITFHGGGNAENGAVDDELATQLNHSAHGKSRTAWFLVDHIVANVDFDDPTDESRWGGAAIVDTSATAVSANGRSMQGVSNTTQLYVKYWQRQIRLPGKVIPSTSPLLAASELPVPERLPLERRLQDLVLASTSPRAIHLGLPPLVILLHSTQRQIGKTYTATTSCSAAGVDSFVISSHDLLSENDATSGGGDAKTIALLETRADRALACGSHKTTLLVRQIELLTANRVIQALQDIIAKSRVFIATTTEIDKIPDTLRSLFTHELELAAPNESEREAILRNICIAHSLTLSPLVDLKTVALKTAALVAGDLVDVISRASLARQSRLISTAESQNISLTSVLVSGGPFTTAILPSDFTTAIAQARSTFSDSIGAPKIPSVTWSDVGGLADQKSAIMETISLPLSRPELFAKGMRKRSGILFYGPPGTGKTLLAKAIATEFSLNFFSVKGPELLNMYIGESEANVRRVFQRARDARPCVVFFDELDSVAPKRGNQGDSGGVMDRIVSQLLAELDGMSSSGGTSEDVDGTGANSNAGGVFVIGATNRPDLLDPALLRPGRFDKMLYLGVSDTHDKQLTILQALTRKFQLGPDVDLQRIAGRLPFTYTGADLYALCSDAMLQAITRKTKLVDARVAQLGRERGEDVSTAYFFDHLATPEDVAVEVYDDDFVAAQRQLVSSVSQKELEHFERIRDQFDRQEDRKHSGRGDEQKVPTSPIVSKALAFRRPSAPVSVNTATRVPLAASATSNTRGEGERRKGSVSSSVSVSSREREKDKKGKGKAVKTRGIGNPDSGVESEGDGYGYGYEDPDDSGGHYGMGMNGSVGWPNGGSGKGKESVSVNVNVKGKGKGKAAVHGIDGNGPGMDDQGGEDEDLYG